METKLKNLLSSIHAPDAAAMQKARLRHRQLAKPPGSLGRLEAFSIQIAGITGRVYNTLSEKHILVFAADNGVTREGVSSAPQSVTLRQAINLTNGKTGAAVLAAHTGSKITVCDVGICADVAEEKVLNRKIAYGTKNIAKGPAMTRQQALKAILTGAEIAETTRADILGIGEMGISNTTTASAVTAALLDVDAEKVTGRGGGLTIAAYQHKKEVIRRALIKNSPNKNDAVDVLQKVGGLDIAAMCGAFLGAAKSHRPVVIDGFVSAAAALCAYSLCPLVLPYLIPSHASYEIGYAPVMAAMSLSPVLQLDMRLGEGSGCPLMFQILDGACAVINQMATFAEAGIDDGYLEEIRKKDAFTT